ncbi:MAG: FAD-dependent monooxygenase [Lysobacter sp.]|nr:FAD-dependent monooxygenase [Lysobacter sp.]
MNTTDTPTSKPALTLVGAGLAGPLLAALLAHRGWRVDLFERRGDPRLHGYAGGRSINLALAERGLNALRAAGVDGDVLKQAVMMRGRMVHFADGRQQLQRYGKDDSEVIWSIRRADLNIVLLNAAEAAGAVLHFDRRLERVDFDARIAHFVGEHEDIAHRFHALIGCDGAGSNLRAAMNAARDLGERLEVMPHSYKELEIPPNEHGDFRIEPNALHIWPRGDYMCIALPNDERTFTVTLFLPNEGPEDGSTPSFAHVRDGDAAQALYDRAFADALPLIPDLQRDFERNPTGMLATLYLDRWRLDGRAVLLGDAAHAMVPFHGQGMNCAFEDCVALADHLARDADTDTAFAAFEAERRPNAAAIQQMALENYREMSDRVDDEDFLLQRELERELAHRHPDRFVPRYAMVAFRRVPYALAFERGLVQRALLVEATAGRRNLDGIDWAWLDREVRARLAPLPAET